MARVELQFSKRSLHFPPPDLLSKKIRLSHKINVEYAGVEPTVVKPRARKQCQSNPPSVMSDTLALPVPEDASRGGVHNAIVAGSVAQPGSFSTSALTERVSSRWPRPEWRRPWKIYRVISGNLGWVRALAFDPSNTSFFTGSADRTIKMWDVASGQLKHTLTGHIGQVRALAVSQKHTYMFSAGDDKMVKCWDLQQNKVIHSYHGHLSGVYCLGLHPDDKTFFTGGRDSVCRAWDIRVNNQIYALSGHENTVCSVFSRPTDPEVVTGSHDSTIKFWDLRNRRTMTTLTNHKKSVRALAQHQDMFASASTDNIKKFSLPKGEFMHNMLSQQKTIINAMAVNEDGVLATGGDNGSLWFWDWKSGHNFQQAQTIVQPDVPWIARLAFTRFLMMSLGHGWCLVKLTRRSKCGKRIKQLLLKLTLSTSGLLKM